MNGSRMDPHPTTLNPFWSPPAHRETETSNLTPPTKTRSRFRSGYDAQSHIDIIFEASRVLNYIKLVCCKAAWKED